MIDLDKLEVIMNADTSKRRSGSLVFERKSDWDNLHMYMSHTPSDGWTLQRNDIPDLHRLVAEEMAAEVDKLRAENEQLKFVNERLIEVAAAASSVLQRSPENVIARTHLQAAVDALNVALNPPP